MAMAVEAEEAAALDVQRHRDEDAARRLQAAEVSGAGDPSAQVLYPCRPAALTRSAQCLAPGQQLLCACGAY